MSICIDHQHCGSLRRERRERFRQCDHRGSLTDATFIFATAMTFAGTAILCVRD